MRPDEPRWRWWEFFSVDEVINAAVVRLQTRSGRRATGVFVCLVAAAIVVLPLTRHATPSARASRISKETVPSIPKPVVPANLPTDPIATLPDLHMLTVPTTAAPPTSPPSTAGPSVVFVLPASTAPVTTAPLQTLPPPPTAPPTTQPAGPPDTGIVTP